jgi:hypothetical protein
MDIAFASRSRFLDACEQAIRVGRAVLDAGGTVRVELDEGGYPGTILVTIHSENCRFFESNWEAADVTRFPARIKAAATALYNCSCFGRFQVVHSDGALAISQS